MLNIDAVNCIEKKYNKMTTGFAVVLKQKTTGLSLWLGPAVCLKVNVTWTCIQWYEWVKLLSVLQYKFSQYIVYGLPYFIYYFINEFYTKSNIQSFN